MQQLQQLRTSAVKCSAMCSLSSADYCKLLRFLRVVWKALFAGDTIVHASSIAACRQSTPFAASYIIMKEIYISCLHLMLTAILILNVSNVNSFSPTNIKTLLIPTSRNDAFTAVIDSRFNNKVMHRDILKSVWRDSVVSLTIPASKEKTYNLFSSLDEHPTWYVSSV
jgi:hypothetical protein